MKPFHPQEFEARRRDSRWERELADWLAADFAFLVAGIELGKSREKQNKNTDRCNIEEYCVVT